MQRQAKASGPRAATLPIVPSVPPDTYPLPHITAAHLRARLRDLRARMVALAPYIAKVTRSGEVVATQAVLMGPECICGPKGPVPTQDPPTEAMIARVGTAVCGLGNTPPDPEGPVVIGGTPTRACLEHQRQVRLQRRRRG